MKGLIRYMLVGAMLAATACVNDVDMSPDVDDVLPDGQIRLTFAVQVPEPLAARTRAMGEEPDYTNFHLWCAVFEGDGTPSGNYLTQVAEAKLVENSNTGDDHNRNFTVTLYGTDLDATIHFIGLNTKSWGITPEDEHEWNEHPKNPKNTVSYGPENVSIPRLKTEGGEEAYWQRIAFGFPLSLKNQEEIDKWVSTTSPVPLIRNFAKISVEVSTQPEEGNGNVAASSVFELTGFCVMNAINSGTIAPFSQTTGFPSFVDWEKFGDNSTVEGNHVNEKHRKPYTYDEITTSKKPEHGLPYAGTRPNNWDVEDPEIYVDDPKDPGGKILNPEFFNDKDKYIYERPFSEDRHTYLILGGIYHSTNTDATHGSYPTYYKIDIGELDTRGLFEFNNLLRNFHYKITITSVQGAGYDDIESAIKGQIYNNNISAAIETQHLLNISDGHDLMFVNFTSYVIVEREEDANGNAINPIELMYRYYEIGDNNSETIQIFGRDYGETDPTYEQGVIWHDSEVGAIEGPVVERAEYGGRYKGEPVPGSNEERIWQVVKIYPQKPTNVLRYQDVVLYRPNGLSRRVRFFLQTPWNLVEWEGMPDKHQDTIENPDTGKEEYPNLRAVVYRGLYDHIPDKEAQPKYEDGDDDATKAAKDVAAERERYYAGFGQGNISHEDGEPLTLFFRLPVGLPKAMFPLEFVIESDKQNLDNDKSGEKVVQSAPSLHDGVTDIRIQYVRVVKWEEYCDETKSPAVYNTLVHNYFTTITHLEALPNTSSETDVIIHNKYFNDAHAYFTRDQNTD